MANDSGLQTEEEYLEYLDSEVCLYCFELRKYKNGCCGENHWGLGKDVVNERT
jgi:hypothetical protein